VSRSGKLIEDVYAGTALVPQQQRGDAGMQAHQRSEDIFG